MSEPDFEKTHPPDEAAEFRSATRAIFELLNQQDRRITVGEAHDRLLAEQIAEVTLMVRNIETRLPDMMAQSLSKVIADPNTWSAGKRAAGLAARDVAGGILLSGVKFVLDKAMWGALFLVAVYWVGGMPALAAFFKLKWGSSP